jgi:hypothetical protein
MSRQAIVSGRVYLLARKNPRTGFTETIVYTGSLRQKPSGWKVVREL